LPSGRRHYRVTLNDANAAHEFALRYGGRPGVIDPGRIEAAIARPYSGYHRSIAAKAAALFEAVVNNHGFVDGNKRSAVLLTDLLIWQSGYDFQPWNEHERFNAALVDFAVNVARGGLTLETIMEWFEQRIKVRSKR
jgi:death-on-curing protein